jgi:hypothetical protein
MEGKLDQLTSSFMPRINHPDRNLRKRARGFARTLLPTSTMGMFSHTRTRSRCQLGTFLYVMRAVTSNMMMAQSAWM